MCLPNGPSLPACNRLVRIENQMAAMATNLRETERTQAMQSQAAASWAQAAAAQHMGANSFSPASQLPVITTCTNAGSTTNCITH
jgi:fructose-specific phosphotransferase system IIC component